jgi:replicative DNA helicase
MGEFEMGTEQAAENFLASVHPLPALGAVAVNEDLAFEIRQQETTVMGRCLDDQDFAAEVDSKWFNDNLHQAMFKLMQDARADGVGIDASVLNELALTKFDVDHCVQISDYEHIAKDKADLYLDRMRDRFAKAEAERIGYQLSQGGDAAKAIERLGRLHRTDRSYSHDPKQLAVNTLNMVNAGVEPGIKTGFSKIDNTFGGLHKSDVIVVAGRPGGGKTALAANIAMQSGKPTLFCSMEQPAHQIMMRLLSNVASVDGNAIRKNQLTNDQREALTVAADHLANSELYIWDKPTATFADLQREAKRMFAEKNIGAIFVDYLGRMKGGEGNAKHEVVGDNIRSLKNLALTLNIPIVVLVQLNRQVDSRDELYLSDLKDSGDIEAEADMVLLMKRLADDDENAKDFTSKITVAKNRHGQCGVFHLDYKAAYCRFENQPDFKF